MAVTLTSITINSAGTQATVVFTESPGTFGTLNTPTAANFVLGVDYTNSAEQEYYAPVAGSSIASVTGNGTTVATVVVNLASVIPARINGANANQEIFQCVANIPANWVTDGVRNSPVATNAATTNNSTKYAVAARWTRWHVSPRERFTSPVRLGVLAFCADGIASVEFINAATGTVIATATSRTENTDCPGLNGRFVYDYNFLFNPANFADGLVNIRARINPTGTNYAARHLNAAVVANSGGTLVNSGRIFHCDSSSRVAGSGTGSFTQWEFARSSAGPIVYPIRTASGNLHFAYQENARTHSVPLSSVTGTPTYGQVVRITDSLSRYGRVLSYSGGTLTYILDAGSNFANTETLQFINELDLSITVQATATVNGTPTAVGSGTIGTGETLTGLSSGATWVTSGAAVANGLDSAGTTGTSVDPYATMSYAVGRAVTLHTTAAGLTVRLIQGRHYISGWDSSAASAVLVQPFDLTTNVRLVPSAAAQASGMLYVSVQGPFTFDARDITPGETNAGLLYASGGVPNVRAWFNNITVLGSLPGQSTSLAVVNAPSALLFSATVITQNCGNGFIGAYRAGLATGMGGDVFTGQASVIEGEANDLVFVTGAHADLWQAFAAGTARTSQRENIILYNLVGYNNNSQGLFVDQGGGDGDICSMWVENFLMQKTGLSTQFSQYGMRSRNVHLRHCTVDQTWMFQDSDVHTATNCSIRRCSFLAMDRTSTAVKATIESNWTIDQNHFVTAPTWGTNATTGSAGFVNTTSRDYSPAVGSALLNRYVSPGNERDATNRLLSTSGAASASIGARQPVATLAATVDGNAITSGGSAAASGIPGGSTTLVFTVGGPTGAVLVVDAGSVGGGLSAMVPPSLPRTLTAGGTTTTATFTATLGTSPGTFNVGTDALADFTGTVTWSSGSNAPFRARMGGNFRTPTGGIRRR